MWQEVKAEFHYITVFLAEGYAANACAMENTERGCKTRNRVVHIPSDNEAVT
jgi:hypothetical protein